MVVIVQDEDANRLVGGLVDEGFRVTRIASTGGLLRRENSSLLLCVEDHDVSRATSIIRRICRRRKQVVVPYAPALEPGLLYFPEEFEVEVGGAVVFVLPVERVERIGG